MCDGSESASPQFHQTAESKQIFTTLGQISKSVDEIKESAKGIKNLEQNAAILSQRIQAMAQGQAQTSATITILRNQITQLTDVQQKAVRLQEQQLLEAKLTRIAAEKTALEAQRLREIAQREESERTQQQSLAAFWHSLHTGVWQVQKCTDTLVQQALVLALRKNIANSTITADELHSIPDKIFASETKKSFDNLVQQLLLHVSAQSELNQFAALRVSWNDSSSAANRLTNSIEQLSQRISELTESISDRSVSLEKKRGIIGSFFYNNFWKSRHERQLEEARGQLAEYQANEATTHAELTQAKAALASVTDSLKRVETSHPSIRPFQPWSVPYVEL